MLSTGTVLDGKYKIIREVGRGGMSVVYLGVNERANQAWAVKEILKTGKENNAAFVQGLVAETELLKMLRHKNLPAIVDVIEREESLIIVMDYIEGKSLLRLVEENGTLPPEKVLDWAKQLCDVLDYLHSRTPPVIYRDMKPSNVMLQPDGTIKLIDFGTAREYKPAGKGDTAWLGTRGYAAPEQFGGQGQTDARTDIYCLGATLYHLLTGRSPADTQFVIHPVGAFVPELAGSGLEKVIRSCCEPEPGRRFADCTQLRYALDHVHEADRDAVRRRNRNWRTFLATVILALSGAAGFVGFTTAKANMVKTSYEACLHAASLEEEIEDAAAKYQMAMELKPGRKEAYAAFLSTVTGDGEISREEKKVLNDALYDSRNGDAGMLSNLEQFRLADGKEYAEFIYDLGFAYYIFDPGGNKEANACFDAAVKYGKRLEEEKQHVADTMRILTDYYAHRSEQAQHWTQEDLEESYDYGALWKDLMRIAKNPAVTDRNTGGSANSIAVYREIANQIANHPSQLDASGVTEDEMQAALKAAGTYMKTQTAGSDGNPGKQELIRQTREAIEYAGKTVEAFYSLRLNEN